MSQLLKLHKDMIYPTIKVKEVKFILLLVFIIYIDHFSTNRTTFLIYDYKDKCINEILRNTFF